MVEVLSSKKFPLRSKPDSAPSSCIRVLRAGDCMRARSERTEEGIRKIESAGGGTAWFPLVDDGVAA